MNVHRAMGSPEYITLYYDAARSLVGFAPAAKDAKRAFKLSAEASLGGNQMGAKLRSFFTHYGINIEQAMRFEPRQRDGIWCVDLNEPIYVYGSGGRK